MARRRDESFFDLIAELPWWVCLILAAFVYVFIKFVIPAIVFSTPAIQAMARGFSQMAWLFALPFLVVAIASAVRQFLRKRLLDRQVNLDSIRALPWEQFEHLVGEAFRRQGYWVEERGGSAPDGGIDLVLLNGGKKAVVQCKQWRNEQSMAIHGIHGVRPPGKGNKIRWLGCHSDVRSSRRARHALKRAWHDASGYG